MRVVACAPLTHSPHYSHFTVVVSRTPDEGERKQTEQVGRVCEVGRGCPSGVRSLPDHHLLKRSGVKYPWILPRQLAKAVPVHKLKDRVAGEVGQVGGVSG